MKVYMFIQMADRRGILDIPRLYAYTTDKNLYQRFMELRDMSLFIKKVCKMNSDEYNDLKKKYSSEILRNVALKTFDKDSFESSVCLLPMTGIEDEISIIKGEEMLNTEFRRKCKYEFSYISNKYLPALNTIGYFDFYISCGDPVMNYEESNMFFSGKRDLAMLLDRYQLRSILFDHDQLALFLYFFGWSMKK